jgi:APA family basic amino acid/polyamine antiporter
LLCGITALSYAELASMFPRAGAEYEYTRQVFPAWASFLVGWTMVVGLMVAAGAIALGFARYLQYFVDVPARVGAIGLLAVEVAFAVGGLRRSARLTVALSSLQVAALVAVVVIGAPHLADAHPLAMASPGGVLGGAALVFFAFIGFDEVITLAEETTNPTKVIPLSLLAALGISTLLYVTVSLAAVAVLGPHALAASPRPIADVVAHVLPGRAEGTVAVVALLTTINTSLLALTAASRLVFGMADSGALPARLATVREAGAVPAAAVLCAGVAAIGFAAIGDLSTIASVTDFAVYVVFLAVNTTVVVLRFRTPDARRPFRSPGSIRGVPVFPVLGFVATLVMIPHLGKAPIGLGAVLLATGLGVYGLLEARRARANPAGVAGQDRVSRGWLRRNA